MVTLAAPEVRTFPALEFRDLDATESSKYLEGRAVPYGVEQDVGWYIETIQKGCFAKSIREAARRLPLLLWHDSRTFPIGVSKTWREEDDGLWATWELDVEDGQAQEAARKARNGMLTGLSVGFIPIKSDHIRSDDDEVMRIVRIEGRLLEVSLTPTPAYAGAKVSLVRTAEHLSRDRRSAKLAAWREYLDKISTTQRN